MKLNELIENASREKRDPSDFALVTSVTVQVYVLSRVLGWRYSMRAILSIILGFMLLTSLVGISYATPIMQPSQSGGDTNACAGLTPNNPNYLSLGCGGAAHQGGNENPRHGCVAPGGRISLEGRCCSTGKVNSDAFCCTDRGTSSSFGVTGIQTDTPYCGPP